jgi:hypothetical protein
LKKISLFLQIQVIRQLTDEVFYKNTYSRQNYQANTRNTFTRPPYKKHFKTQEGSLPRKQIPKQAALYVKL